MKAVEPGAHQGRPQSYHKAKAKQVALFVRLDLGLDLGARGARQSARTLATKRALQDMQNSMQRSSAQGNYVSSHILSSHVTEINLQQQRLSGKDFFRCRSLANPRHTSQCFLCYPTLRIQSSAREKQTKKTLQQAAYHVMV